MSTHHIVESECDSMTDQQPCPLSPERVAELRRWAAGRFSPSLTLRSDEVLGLLDQLDQLRALVLASEGVLVDAPALAARERELREAAEAEVERVRAAAALTVELLGESQRERDKLIRDLATERAVRAAASYWIAAIDGWAAISHQVRDVRIAQTAGQQIRAAAADLRRAVAAAASAAPEVTDAE